MGKVRNFAPKFVIEYSMKRVFQVFCGLLTASWLLASCLSSDDGETTRYDDMAVSSFTLGTLNRYLHTTARSGADSIYKATFAANGYKMSIDQLNHRIYNTVGLPQGTDVAHVVCTVTTRNNGVVYVKSTTSDTLAYFQSAKDSIDFRQPRVFRVFANDGSGSRDYVVTLNVRQQASGQVQWTQMPSGTPLPETHHAGWEFALSQDGPGIVASNDHWATVVDEPVSSDDSQLLPTHNISSTCWNLRKGIVYALMIGDSDLMDDAAVVWRRLIDSDQSTEWTYLTRDEDNRYYLPKGRSYWLLPFVEGSVLAIDGTGKIYQSRDQGITWKTTSLLVSPVSAVSAAAVDADGGLWLAESGTGAVWYGKLTE